MPTYKCEVTVIKTYTAQETLTIEVSADDKEDAMSIAEDQAINDCRIRALDACLDDTESECCSAELVSEDDCGDEIIIPRCDKTLDMFSAA